jgi:hypothetical protein
LTRRNKVLAVLGIAAAAWLLSGLLIEPAPMQQNDDLDPRFEQPKVTIVVPPASDKPATPDAAIDAGAIEVTPQPPAVPPPEPVTIGNRHRLAL